MDRWEELEDWIDRMAARAHGVPVDWPLKTPNQMIELVRELREDIRRCREALEDLERMDWER
jgi:hypothetical protein